MVLICVFPVGGDVELAGHFHVSGDVSVQILCPFSLDFVLVELRFGSQPLVRFTALPSRAVGPLRGSRVVRCGVVLLSASTCHLQCLCFYILSKAPMSPSLSVDL